MQSHPEQPSPNPPKLPYQGVRPQTAEIWSANAERVCKILMPPNTKPETAETGIRSGVIQWIESLDRKQHLKIVSEVKLFGPWPCPFLENYGDDMYLARARFRSTKPRLVPEDMVVANRQFAGQVGYSYEQFRGAPEKALPDDWLSQLEFVESNPYKVYDDLMHLERLKSEPEPEDDTGL